MNLKLFAAIGTAVLLSTACTPSGYRKATVIKMAIISEPDNLADDVDCRTLWGDIARFGIDMDEARDDWNEVILEAATALIEKGCVKTVQR